MPITKEMFDSRVRETGRYLKRLKSTHELIFVTTSHLLTEYVINKIIENRCQSPELLIRNPYLKKLQIIYCLGLLPDYLYEDLIILNKLRNKFAHNLHPNPQIFSFKTINLDRQDIIIVSNFDPNAPCYLGASSPYKEFLSDMCVSIFFLLVQHTLWNLDIDISFNEPT